MSNHASEVWSELVNRQQLAEASCGHGKAAAKVPDSYHDCAAVYWLYCGEQSATDLWCFESQSSCFDLLLGKLSCLCL